MSTIARMWRCLRWLGCDLTKGHEESKNLHLRAATNPSKRDRSRVSEPQIKPDRTSDEQTLKLFHPLQEPKRSIHESRTRRRRTKKRPQEEKNPKDGSNRNLEGEARRETKPVGFAPSLRQAADRPTHRCFRGSHGASKTSMSGRFIYRRANRIRVSHPQSLVRIGFALQGILDP